jgi:hypothetical protein
LVLRNRGLLVFLLTQLVTTSSLHTLLAESLETQSNTSKVHLEDPSLENVCSFLAGLYVELTTSYGCIRESPVVENSTCYTSTNLLAGYVLRNLCSKTLLAKTTSGNSNVWFKSARVKILSYSSGCSLTKSLATS